VPTLSVPPLWGILLGFQTLNFFELGNFVPTLSISPVLGEILYLEDTLSSEIFHLQKAVHFIF
jgi:hypothetical protein